MLIVIYYSYENRRFFAVYNGQDEARLYFRPAFLCRQQKGSMQKGTYWTWGF